MKRKINYYLLDKLYEDMARISLEIQRIERKQKVELSEVLKQKQGLDQSNFENDPFIIEKTFNEQKDYLNGQRSEMDVFELKIKEYIRLYLSAFEK